MIVSRVRLSKEQLPQQTDRLIANHSFFLKIAIDPIVVEDLNNVFLFA